MANDALIPFDVITGFLGAGKTTLLNRLLADPHMAGALVIVNEFGEAGLDHQLVEHATGEVFTLASGCLCCSLRGDLVETLIDVLQRREKGALSFDRVIVETSGLAEPGPVLHAVIGNLWIMERLRLETVLAVVDAVNGPDVLNRHPEATEQVAVADRLLITKTDLPEGAAGLPALRERLRALNAGAPIRLAADRPEPAELLAAGGVADWRERLTEPNADHAHSHGITSFVLRHDGVVTMRGLEIFLDLLKANFGPGLLRVKGLVKVRGMEETPVVIHGVRHLFHPPDQLDGWPDGIDGTHIVFIVQGVPEAEVTKLFAAIADPLSGSGEAAGDDTLSLLPDGDG